MVEPTEKEINYVGYFPSENPSIFSVLKSSIEKMSKVKYTEDALQGGGDIYGIVVKRELDTDFIIEYDTSVGDTNIEKLTENKTY